MNKMLHELPVSTNSWHFSAFYITITVTMASSWGYSVVSKSSLKKAIGSMSLNCFLVIFGHIDYVCVSLHATRETSTCHGTARHHIYDLYGGLGMGFRCPQFSLFLRLSPFIRGIGWQTFWGGCTWWAFRCHSLDGCSPLYHGRGHCGTYSIFFMASFL